MANSKRNRSELKSFFVKNSIPTESNFADLIDGMLNQLEDGLIKLPGDPLRITADDNQGLKKIINLFEKPEDATPVWSLQLNPRADGSDPNKSNPGFCVADGQSNLPRLFIDKATGNVGIGTNRPVNSLDVSATGNIKLGLEGNGGGQLVLTNNKNDNKIILQALSKDGAGSAAELLLTGKNALKIPKITLEADVTNITGNTGISLATGAVPIAKLDIAQSTRTGAHPTAVKGLYVTGEFGTDSDGVEFRHSNAAQGIGFGSNTIYAAGSLPDQDLQLKAKGKGNLRVLSHAVFNGNIIVGGSMFDAKLQSERNDYNIELCGSSFDSTEKNNNFLKVNDINIKMDTLRGLNTVLLNPDGTFKAKNNHDIHGFPVSWNAWADWVNENANFGDVVAVASNDAIENAPTGGSAEKLLNSIQAEKAFSNMLSTKDFTLKRVPYALLFIYGRTALEVATAIKDKNARLKTTYQILLQQFNQWKTPVLLNGWKNYLVFDPNNKPVPDIFSKARFFKDNQGVVWLRGLLLPGISQQPMFILPEGYRPAYVEIFSVLLSSSTGRVDILPNGTVTLSTAVTASVSNFVSLNNICFRASPFLNELGIDR